MQKVKKHAFSRGFSDAKVVFLTLIGLCMHGSAYISMTRQVPRNNADTLHAGFRVLFVFAELSRGAIFCLATSGVGSVSKDLIPPIPSFPHSRPDSTK